MLGNKISLKNIYGKTQEIFTLINNAGVEINKQSRFYRFRESLLKEIEESKENVIEVTSDGAIQKTINFDRLFKRTNNLGQGMRDFIELWAIASSETILKNNQNELKQIFGGNVDQFEDKLSNTRARDLQYQLFLTAIFELSGLEVECLEPDFRFKFDQQYSVACKRINSPSQMHKRIKEAEKQIEKSKTKGLIALSLDRLVGLNFHNSTTDAYRLIQFAREMIHGILDGNYPDRLPELKDCVLGIILSLSMIGMNLMTDELGFGHAFEILIYDRGDEEMNCRLMDFTRSFRLDVNNLV